MRCPECNNKLLQRSGSTTRLRTKGIHTFDTDGRCTAQCFWCGAKVYVPIRIEDGIQVPSESFYVKERSAAR